MAHQIEDLFRSISNENYIALSKGLTLVESSKDDDRKRVELLMKLAWHQNAKKEKKAIKLGITGSPGAGKSSFINTIVPNLLPSYPKIAILPIDPSSAESGGSILGDQTRMEHIVTNDHVYIRPSPSKLHLGGTARSTYESILLCEAANFDLIIVETVGVGQSEIAIQNMVDIIAYLFTPLGGDILQGIKKGIMEIAQFIVLNKFDDANDKANQDIYQQFKEAIHLTDSRTIEQQVLAFSLYRPETHEQFVKSLEHYISNFINHDPESNKKKQSKLYEYFLKLEMENLYNKTVKNSTVYNNYLEEVVTSQTSPFEAAKKVIHQTISK